jgi:outer membrane receptor protein involved in Fe transport
MSGQIHWRILSRAVLRGGSALLVLSYLGAQAHAQVQLPEVVVSGAKPKPKPKAAPRRVVARPVPAAPPPAAAAAPVNAATTQNATLDQSRATLYAPLGTAPTNINHATIEAMPQGTNAPIEKVILQAPGVTQDSAASGSYHVRNEHANVQIRINGIMLPDGVSGFGTFLDTAFIGNISLITGALPAQFGLRTSGVLDITTRTDAFNNTGNVGIYGGSRGWITPYFDYGGTVGGCASTAPLLVKATAAANCYPATQYFFTGRYFQSDIGLENPTSSWNAIHDHTQQERGFGYVSTLLDPYTRFSVITGASYGAYQIPNNPGQTPNFTAFGVSSFDSAALNENQFEQNYFGVAAWQRSVNGADAQLSYFTRYSTVHFVPDVIGDLVFNGVSSDVYRASFSNGFTGDFAYRVNDSHTLRAGYLLRNDYSQVSNQNVLLPVDMFGNPVDAPFATLDESSKLGYTVGLYVQDEWQLTNQLMLNFGGRFDQYWAYISENQFSPRASLTWKPFAGTTFHAGYARTFTPPEQVLAAPTNLDLVQGTTQQPSVPFGDPVRAERADVYDVGVTQQVLPGLEIGIDAYYKWATNLIDDGQFGAAYVLTAFNYAKGKNVGTEISAKYKNGNFQAYGNIAFARQWGTDPVSNQFLFDNATPLATLGGLTEYQYLQTHWVYTDHTQFVTASAGFAYQFCGGPASWSWQSLCGTKVSADMIYGSGLRSGDANIGTVPAYTQVNLGVAREFLLSNDPKPVTIRFDIVNLFDEIYFIRDGSGIGVFAPQYGPRRGYFVGISKKI